MNQGPYRTAQIKSEPYKATWRDRIIHILGGHLWVYDPHIDHPESVVICMLCGISIVEHFWRKAEKEDSSWVSYQDMME